MKFHDLFSVWSWLLLQNKVLAILNVIENIFKCIEHMTLCRHKTILPYQPWPFNWFYGGRKLNEFGALYGLDHLVMWPLLHGLTTMDARLQLKLQKISPYVVDKIGEEVYMWVTSLGSIFCQSFLRLQFDWMNGWKIHENCCMFGKAKELVLRTYCVP